MSKNLATFDIDMLYNVLSKAKAKDFKSLSTKKGRDRERLFIVEGEKGIRDTINYFNLRYLIATNAWLEQNPEVLPRYKDKILATDKRGIEIISSLHNPSEVIAIFELPEEITGQVSLDKTKSYLLLDEIQDPGNLGTIIRTCDWFGIYDIFASPNTVDVYSPKVVQATMGSLARVKVSYVDLEDLILNNRDMKLIGTLLEGCPLKDIRIPRGSLILMGNEGNGISEKLKNLIDIAITIPPSNPQSHPDSLNVAIATAIILSSITTT